MRSIGMNAQQLRDFLHFGKNKHSLLVKVGIKLKSSRNRLDGNLVYQYQLDREIIEDSESVAQPSAVPQLLLEAFALKYQLLSA